MRSGPRCPAISVTSDPTAHGHPAAPYNEASPHPQPITSADVKCRGAARDGSGQRETRAAPAFKNTSILGDIKTYANSASHQWGKNTHFTPTQQAAPRPSCHPRATLPPTNSSNARTTRPHSETVGIAVMHSGAKIASSTPAHRSLQFATPSSSSMATPWTARLVLVPRGVRPCDDERPRLGPGPQRLHGGSRECDGGQRRFGGGPPIPRPHPDGRSCRSAFAFVRSRPICLFCVASC